MKITIVGSGYAAFVTSACSDLGNDVVCLDVGHGKIDQIKSTVKQVVDLDGRSFYDPIAIDPERLDYFAIAKYFTRKLA